MSGINQKARSAQEGWLAGLGVAFVDVYLLVPGEAGGYAFVVERHVNDLTTISETVKMSLETRRGRAAVYPYMGRWALWSRFKPREKQMRYYDSREAAEMIAIHDV